MAILCTTDSGTRVALISCAIHKRKTEDSDIGDNIVVKRRRRPALTAKEDSQWLKTVIREFEALKYPARSDRYNKIDAVKKYFSRLNNPTDRDQYLFSDIDDARQFLVEQETLNVPIFVENGLNTNNIDLDAEERPIEQLFNYITNDSEWLEHDDQSNVDESKDIPIWTIQQIEDRFRARNGHVKYPLNFPDIETPLLDKALPAFLQIPECTLLHDLLRGILNLDDKSIASDPPRNRKKPYLLNDEFKHVTTAWRLWQGTTMLSEPGTITPAHFDKYSMPTWITCAEGEIGFAWLVRPTPTQQVQWKARPRSKPRGRWVFRVLRAGDALYMPAGTVHVVFRRPRGRQTLGFAGHVLRKRDLGDWLQTLVAELGAEVGFEDRDRAPYGFVLPPLMREVRAIVKAVRTSGREESFGGGEELSRALTLVDEVEKLIDALGEVDTEESDMSSPRMAKGRTKASYTP